MNIKIVKNKYVNSFLLLLLFTAIIHFLVLCFLFIKSRDIYFLNYFSILNLNYFVPNFLNSFIGNIFSIIFVIILYLIILKINNQE